MTPAENSEVIVAIARIEGKIDLTLAETAALKAADADHETRIRTIEGQPIPDPETKRRLSVLEDRRTVSPAQLWTGLLGVAGLILTVLTIADRWSTLFN